MFMVKHYWVNIYHHRIACTDITICKNLQWKWVYSCFTEKRMYDCVILKTNHLPVCVYNVDCEGKIVEKRVTVPIRGKFMKRWDFKRSLDFLK